MCPNHAEQILVSSLSFCQLNLLELSTQRPKRRIPKQNTTPIEVTKPRQWNNGNIDVIHPESASSSQALPKVNVDEVLINGRRYRVPERVIVLDFWNKVGKNTNIDEQCVH